MKVGISLGANLGDRLQNMQQAKRFLVEISKDGYHISSPLYESEPVGCPPNSPKFLNAVVEIEYEGEPKKLLKLLQGFEDRMGRDRNLPKNAARTIDLDILYVGEKEILEDDLVVPHPRIANRRFVLLPLSTVCADRIIKGTGKTVKQLLRETSDKSDVTFLQQDW
jgi:2-amino-4-hydroxy-6-hydroxymethyldihydropteridine diphosphokinase